MRYAVIGLVLCSVGTAYVPSSFRWQSTAGLWEDDYDLLLEPARLPLVDGSRIYTNLSNLVSNQEEQFGTRAENVFLFGGSSSLFGPVFPGLVFDRRSARSPLFTGLVREETDSLFGTGRLVFTEFEDRDSNGTYDYRHQMTEEAESWDEWADTDVYGGLGLKLGALRLGGGCVYTESSYTTVSPWYQYNLDLRDSNLVTGELTFVQAETLVGSDWATSSRTRFSLGGWYDLTRPAGAEGEELKPWLSLGLGANYALLSENTAHSYRGRMLEDRSPGNPLIADYERLAYTDTLSTPYGGSSASVRASAFYYPVPELESRFHVLAYTQSLEAGGDGGIEVLSADSVCHPGTAQAADTTWHSSSGLRSGQGLEFGTSQLVTLDERFFLGFGVRLAAGAWEDSLADSTWCRDLYTYDNGDGIQGREDYKMTVRSAEQWMYRETGKLNVLTLPVGFEYRIVAPLSLRLGAVHRMTRQNVTRVSELAASEPEHVRIEYGDGTFRETIGEYRETPGTSEKTSTESQTTQFSYGIGYRPIENLQIDLMGFRQLTDLARWQVSVTFRF